MNASDSQTNTFKVGDWHADPDSGRLQRKYEEALSASDKTLLINPARMQANVYRVLILYRMGQIEDAEWQADQLLSLHPTFNVNVWAERQPFRDKQVIDAMLEDLATVGLN